MIRRESISHGGVSKWVLIDQIAHARLAGQLLNGWSRTGLEDSPYLAQELEWAVNHHDDGWKAWDLNPGLDDSGKPYAFTEMPAAEASRIWSESIRLAQQRSELAAWLVAHHFLILAANDDDCAPFRAQHQSRCDRNRQVWLTSDEGRASGPEQTELAGQLLRLFDWLSLLLCCRSLSDPVTLPLPMGTVELRADSEFELTLDPWPFVIDTPQPPQGTSANVGHTRTLSESALSLPVAAYSDVKQLKRAASTCQLTWTLRSPRNN